jgi:hypothetical protein
VNPWIFELGLGALAVAAWFGLYGLLLLVTRPRGVVAQSATPDLGPEPPAVASLIASAWELTDDAAEATLLDLGARKFIEFRQPADDPLHTTIHIRESEPSGLSRYEQRVFDRVSGLATGGVVPLTALTFRDSRRARSWWRHLRAEIVADARLRGVSQRRFGPAAVTTLVVAAGFAALGVLVAVLAHETRTNAEEPWDAAFSAGVFAFIVLAGFGLRSPGEKDTAKGREVAGRWLGVRDWLRAHESFADLPPSAVAVWDRYLPYGAALGTTRVSSAVIDMGMGNRKLVWSSFGGAWHRVRVRYPRFGTRYGATAPQVFLRRVVAVAIGYVLVRWWRPVVGEFAAADFIQDNPVAQRYGPIQAVGFGIGIALLAYGLYGIVRMVIDLAAPVTITGQVLWIQLWRQTSGNSNSSRRPTVYYCAIDDGTSDRTTAWALPAGLSGTCDAGDTVTVKTRRWTRRIGEVRVVERGTHGHAAGSESVPADQEKLVAALLGTGPGSASRPTIPLPSTLLTAEEVGQALGMAVTMLEAPIPGPFRMAQYESADRGKTVLLVQVTGGMMGRLTWRGNSRGTQLQGIGDGAFVRGEQAAAKVGDTVVLLTLMRPALGRGDSLPWLLQQAVSRIAAPAVATPAAPAAPPMPAAAPAAGEPGRA